MIKQESIKRGNTNLSIGATLAERETFQAPRGDFILELHDVESGELLEHFERKNIITRDAGVLASFMFSTRESERGLYMLSIGTGATGDLLNPTAPTNIQRKLNNEISRKSFSSVVYRDSNGAVSSVPTNIVDYTTTFSESEAVGPLNEMGVISPISLNSNIKTLNPDSYPNYDTTVDIRDFDVLVNYLTFSVISKPSTAVLTITWRFTF
jgi:hypothetical protein